MRLKNYLTVALLASFFIISDFGNAHSDDRKSAIWYFGALAGLDFRGGEPIALTNGNLSTSEGCATISDSLGNLLFYSDGVQIWNRNHVVMSNGSGLKGNSSSTQSAIIIPKPGSNTEYYVFTVDAAENNLANGVSYNLVDMTQNSGLGKVVEKNSLLIKLTCEKITAVYHKNGKDIWLITHLWNNDIFHAYLITANGVGKQPVISKIGAIHTGEYNNGSGYLKASPDGKRIALAREDDAEFEIFDFDSETGKISNGWTLSSTGAHAYGVEFSPDGSKLYCSYIDGSSGFDDGCVYQFDIGTAPITASTIQSVRSSVVKLNTAGGSNQQSFGALQLGPNGKIYIANSNLGTYLSVIKEPNLKGTACGFEYQGVYLKGRVSTHGLPTFFQSFFVEEPCVVQSIGLPHIKHIGNGQKFSKSIPVTLKADPQRLPVTITNAALEISCTAGQIVPKSVSFGSFMIKQSGNKQIITISCNPFTISSPDMTLGEITFEFDGTDMNESLLKIEGLGGISCLENISLIDGSVTIVNCPVSSVELSDNKIPIGTDFEIPIIASVYPETFPFAIPEAIINIAYLKSAFLINGVDKGEIQTYFKDDTAFSEIVLRNVEINSEHDIICNLKCFAYLTPDYAYNIEIKSFKTIEECSEVELNNGEFIPLVCSYPIRGIKLFKPATLSVNPLPVTDKSLLKVETQVKGLHKITIIDINGSEVWSNSFVHTGEAIGIYNLEIPDLPTGVYNAALTSASGIQTILMPIVK